MTEFLCLWAVWIVASWVIINAIRSINRLDRLSMKDVISDFDFFCAFLVVTALLAFLHMF